jgi:hypothetical protein
MMGIQNLHRKQASFHKAFNYLSLPMGMDKMPLYAYYCETKFIKFLEAKKLGVKCFRIHGIAFVSSN